MLERSRAGSAAPTPCEWALGFIPVRTPVGELQGPAVFGYCDHVVRHAVRHGGLYLQCHADIRAYQPHEVSDDFVGDAARVAAASLGSSDTVPWKAPGFVAGTGSPVQCQRWRCRGCSRIRGLPGGCRSRSPRPVAPWPALAASSSSWSRADSACTRRPASF